MKKRIKKIKLETISGEDTYLLFLYDNIVEVTITKACTGGEENGGFNLLIKSRHDKDLEYTRCSNLKKDSIERFERLVLKE